MVEKRSMNFFSDSGGNARSPPASSIPDSGGDDIQHQGPPAQAEGGDQEDVQGEEVLDQGQLRPINIKKYSIGNARVSIADG